MLFGSHLGGAFVLDTVFVVSDWIDHRADDWRRVVVPDVPREYVEITLEPWYAAPKQRDSAASYRLYRGATPEYPVVGMYSFFPCARARETPQGFARPAIALPGVITPPLKQGKRLNRQSGLAACAELWRNVRDQVVSAGLSLGVRAAMPPRREAGHEERPPGRAPSEVTC